MDSILIIDDEPQIRKLLSRMMELEGYEVFQAADCQSTLKQLKLHNPQVVLCDVFLPDGNGVDMVTTIKKLYPELEVILLTAHGNIPDGVQAIKNGAFDYITKGDDNNKIIPLISRAMAQAKKNVGEKVKTEETQSFSFDAIKGKSEGMQQAVALARKVSATDVTVLLTGETGTGKEVFAQAIHRNSLRKENAFVAVNCSAFSKDLLESEIFGHKAGSFTGAMKDKKGLFEVADNGTIFLDEIGEMAFELQAKLLRVLEAGEYIKIGDTKPTKVNVRVISATNRDLKKEIEQGNFREDLYYRLSVFQIHLPPLRERKTMNTHLHILEPYTNLFRVWKDTRLERQLRNLIGLFTERILNIKTGHLELFFNDDWVSKYRIVSYGHDIEASWLIHEAALVLGDKDLLEKVEPLVEYIAAAADEGLTPDGSMIYETFLDKGKTGTDRHWWVQAENVVGHANLYQHFDDEVAMQKALRCWDFIKQHLVDYKYGEWHWSVRADGTVNTDDDKAGFWKCPYHNGRMCMEIIERFS